MSAGPFRILVTGSRDWDDTQGLRHALITASVPHLPAIVVIHGACPAGADAMTAEWALDYGVRAEEGRAAAGADICLAFIRGGSSEASRFAVEAERAGTPVRRYLRPGVS